MAILGTPMLASPPIAHALRLGNHPIAPRARSSRCPPVRCATQRVGVNEAFRPSRRCVDNLLAKACQGGRREGGPAMHTQTLGRLQHSHVFLGPRHDKHERRTWSVVALTAVTMVAEIVGGMWFGSMALVADG